MNNLIFLTDSYKVSHHNQYPKGTKYVYSYFESRGGEVKEICFFGLQYLIKKYLCGQVVTQEMINEASELYEKHFGPNQNIFNNPDSFEWMCRGQRRFARQKKVRR